MKKDNRQACQLGRVLIIAGSDPSGGAGLQADIKTVTMLGAYAASAISCITVQDTSGVYSVQQLSVNIICDQINSVLNDIGADVIKIGMIGDLSAAQAIGKILQQIPDIPVVLDPVLIASSGDALAQEGMSQFLNETLVPRATLVTPNLPEAMALTGTEDAQKAAAILVKKGAQAALVKGGHGLGESITDTLYTEGKYTLFKNSRVETRHTHGTGCTLASAVAAGLANGQTLLDAVHAAIEYVHEAIRTAPEFNLSSEQGHGPLNHGHPLYR